MCKVAILDTGVNTKHEKLATSNIQCYHIEHTPLNSITIVPGCSDTIGHGTAICGIIVSELPEVELIVFQIFDDYYEIKDERLICALEYIYNFCDVDIINMSMGCTMCQNRKKLANICDKLAQKGVVLVASYDNDGAISYPAAFKSVIGVDFDMSCKKNDEFIFIENSVVNILAKGINQKVCWSNNTDYIIGAGSSFATAHITSYIAKAIFNAEIKERGLDSARLYLRKNAKSIIICDKSKDTPKCFDYNRIAVFPVNKETTSILNYSEMLNGTLTHIFDVKQFGRINKSMAFFCHRDNRPALSVLNVELIEKYINDFDTLVVGHTEEITQITCIDYKKVLCQICLKYNKNIFFLGEPPQGEFQKFVTKSLICYSPIISSSQVRFDCLGRLRVIATPIVMIAGTSSKQGKFSLQLSLRQAFLNNGYKVGQWSTEPQAQLFSIDEVFPAGYNSFLDLDENQILEIVNYQLSNIEEMDPDIIITGIQSFTLPYNLINTKMYPYRQHSIISALQPDGIVLCVNIYDELDYIHRVINYLESVTQGKIICIAVYPIGKKGTWSFQEFREYFCELDEINQAINTIKERFDVPVFSMNNTNEICQSIINYLS